MYTGHEEKQFTITASVYTLVLRSNPSLPSTSPSCHTYSSSP